MLRASESKGSCNKHKNKSMPETSARTILGSDWSKSQFFPAPKAEMKIFCILAQKLATSQARGGKTTLNKNICSWKKKRNFSSPKRKDWGGGGVTIKEPPALKETPTPLGSMYCIFTGIYHKNQLNMRKYTVHGWYGTWITSKSIPLFLSHTLTRFLSDADSMTVTASLNDTARHFVGQ